MSATLEPEPEVPCGPWRMGEPWPGLVTAPHKYRCMTCGHSSNYSDQQSGNCRRGMRLVTAANGEVSWVSWVLP